MAFSSTSGTIVIACTPRMLLLLLLFVVWSAMSSPLWRLSSLLIQLLGAAAVAAAAAVDVTLGVVPVEVVAGLAAVAVQYSWHHMASDSYAANGLAYIPMPYIS